MTVNNEVQPKIPFRQTFSWAMWDWATQPFWTVITTFVFSVYVTSVYFISPELAALSEDDPSQVTALAGLTSTLGWATGAAGVIIAILAPMLGQRADRSGRRKRSVLTNTVIIAVIQAMMFFVAADQAFFLFGVILLAAGNVFAEIAAVSYNSMLNQVSTPATRGRVSGLGWGLGYIGGIFALVVVVFGFVQGDWFGLGDTPGIGIRAAAVMCAVWTMIFTIPMWLFVPENVVSNPEPKIGIVDSYKSLFRQVGELRRTSNHTFRFLVASAVYRDGLAGVFTFGGVIAASIYGFTFTQVMIFGIAANLVAGVSTIVSGRLDDRFGARHVILYSLGSLVVLGTAAFILKDAGAAAFWAVGLLLSTFVGPAQAASRSFLARVAPAGREGEIFGLYATTGRAASFLAPTAWAALIAATGDTAWGILGIVLVLGVGFLLMLGVGRLGR